MAVDAARGVVIVSGWSGAQANHVFVYSLADGKLVRSFGGNGSDKGQFDWYDGGLCVTPRGTLLVAERYNSRVQEVSIDDGTWVRFLGKGVLDAPESVTCSKSVIGVAEYWRNRVTLLSWVDGSLLARCGSDDIGGGRLSSPCGLQLLADGSGVVVADRGNDRLCIFSISSSGACAFVRSIPTGRYPVDVVECDGGASFLCANYGDHTLYKVSVASGAVVPFGRHGSGDGEFDGPTALATVPCGDSDSGVNVVVLEYTNSRLQVFRA